MTGGTLCSPGLPRSTWSQHLPPTSLQLQPISSTLSHHTAWAPEEEGLASSHRQGGPRSCPPTSLLHGHLGRGNPSSTVPTSTSRFAFALLYVELLLQRPNLGGSRSATHPWHAVGGVASPKLPAVQFNVPSHTKEHVPENGHSTLHTRQAPWVSPSSWAFKTRLRRGASPGASPRLSTPRPRLAPRHARGKGQL